MDIDYEDNVRRAQEGNGEAFILLMRMYESQMYNVAKSIVKRDEDCADAMQESVLKAFKAISALNNAKFFKTWLFRILINECNNILRKRVQTVTVSDLPNSDILQFSHDTIDLREAVDRLEEIPRTIVILHYYQDLPLQQIADLLELSEGAVKTRLHRARRTMYEWLSDPAERKMNG